MTRKEYIRLGLRIPKEMNKRLEEAARERYISKNTLAIHIFKQWIEAYANENASDPPVSGTVLGGD